MPLFIPGLELNERYYFEILAPLMKKYFPGQKYSAGLIGIGSDVLGFDTATSMDHNWGPRCLFFLPDRNFNKQKSKIDAMFKKSLPFTFMGFSTNFAKPNRKSYLVQPMAYKKSGPVNHGINFFTVRGFFNYFLGFDPKSKPAHKDWLTFPQQALIEVTSGKVFHDGLGELNSAREKFAYYPKNVWLYLIRTQWGRMANELAFHARSGSEGDELGSNILADRSVAHMMQMGFLFERKYWPYTKWFGSAFVKLNCARQITPMLMRILHSISWRERQEYINMVMKILGKTHNSLGITEKARGEIKNFHNRGYKVFEVAPFIRATERAISDKSLRKMRFPLGAVDQFIDHSKINQENYVYKKLKPILK